MKIVQRSVYYCEFCKRHRLTAKAIETHEPRCIHNPARSECGWHKETPPSAPGDFALVFKDDPDVERLRQEMGGCPACILAVIVQARALGLSDEDAWGWNYKDEVERFRAEERVGDQIAEMYV